MDKTKQDTLEKEITNACLKIKQKLTCGKTYSLHSSCIIIINNDTWVSSCLSHFPPPLSPLTFVPLLTCAYLLGSLGFSLTQVIRLSYLFIS